MNPASIVQQKYPMAISKYMKPIYEIGQSDPVRIGYWAIMSEQALGATHLGQGATEGAAWEDAARNVSQGT